MLQGILMVLAFALCYLLVYLAYGKEGMEVRRELGMRFSTIFQTACVLIVLIFYALLIGLWGMKVAHDWWEYAALVGVPVLYGLYVLYARSWSKRAAKELEEEKEAERKEKWEKQEAERQYKEELAIREEKKEERIVAAKKAVEDNPSFDRFMQSVAGCQKYSEVLACWDGLNPADNEINTLIRQDIEAKRSVERMYGSTPEKVAAFLETLRQTYGHVDLETEKAEETEILADCPAYIPPQGFESFLESAGACRKYAEVLTLWDSCDWSGLGAAEKLREAIATKVTIERMYGSRPEKIPAFLQQLRELCEQESMK